MKFSRLLLNAVVAFGIIAFAYASAGNPAAAAESSKVPVNVDNFIRVATDLELKKYATLAGGINQFYHFRSPTPVEKQPTVRMNRDTLYSAAVVDASKGATLIFPDVGDRYMTAMIVDQDHYVVDVLSGGGTFKLNPAKYSTPYIIVFMRVLVDAADAEDVAAVNKIQDNMKIKAASANPFVMPDYDVKSFEAMVAAILRLGPFVPDSFRMFGSKNNVDAFRHYIGTAGGWGGLPESQAFYVNVDPGLPVAAYKIEVPTDVPVDAFWSISLYNAEGFFAPNSRNAYNINSVSGERNADGSMTVHLGKCDDDRVNCLPIMEGWNYTVRLYQPRAEILNGSWKFPDPQRME